MNTSAHIARVEDAHVIPAEESATAGQEPSAVPQKRPRSRRRLELPQVIIALGSAVALLYFGREVLLPVALAGVAGAALSPIVGWLQARHLPRAVVAALVVCLVIATVVGCFYYFVKPAAAWSNQAPEHIAQLKKRLTAIVHPRTMQTLGISLDANEPGQQENGSNAGVQQVASKVFTWTGSVLVMAVETIALLYLLLASGDSFVQKAVHVAPRLSEKKEVLEIAREIQQGISRYLFSVTGINICVGLIVAAGLALLKMPNPLMWGALATLVNFVPYLGPAVGIIVLTIAGLSTFDNLSRALTPPMIYFGVHLIEANVVTPCILGRRLTLNPVMVFVSLIFWASIWGVPGALISVPLLMCVKIVCDHVPSWCAVSEFLE